MNTYSVALISDQVSFKTEIQAETYGDVSLSNGGKRYLFISNGTTVAVIEKPPGHSIIINKL